MAVKLYHLGGIVELFIFRYLHGFPDPILIAYSQYYAVLDACSTVQVHLNSKCVMNVMILSLIPNTCIMSFISQYVSGEHQIDTLKV